MDLTVLVGGGTKLTADKSKLVIGDWTGSADKVVLQAADAQARLVEALVVLDGEGTTTPPDNPGGNEDPNLPVNDGLTEATAFTVQDAIYVAKNSTENKEYYVKAVVGKDISIKSGVASFELVDGTTDGKLTVVKAKSFAGAAFDGTEPLEWLDEVVLKGKVKEYSTLPAIVDGQLVKWNGKTSFTEPVSSTNDGLTLETAFTASEANAWILANLTSGKNTGDTKYYVKGKIYKINQKNNVNQDFATDSYHQATFFISDDGAEATANFEAYQVNYLEGKTWEEGQTDVAVGDEVVLYGPLARYNDIAETAGKGAAYLYSLNGKTTAETTPVTPPATANDGLSLEKAFTASEANAWVLANLTSGKNTGDTKYYVKGKIYKINQKNNVNQDFATDSYHQATFFISDDGAEATANFEAYQVNYLEGKTWEEGQTDVAVGDEVVLYGPLARYNDIAETAGKGAAYLYSLNGKTTAETTPVTPPATANDGLSLEKAFTASEAREWVLANISGNNNTGDTKYYVKGKISKMAVSKDVEQTYTNCASYGNASFYLTDDGTDTDNWFEAYQVNYLEGKKWEAGQTDVAVGDEVVVYGPLARYGDTPETQGKGVAYLYSLNGVTTAPSTGDPTTGDPTTGGDGAIEFVFTSADAVTQSGVTVTVAKGEGTTAPAWNANYNELRLYVKNTVTISSTANMAKIEYYWHKQGQKTFNSVSMTSTEGTYTDCEASTSATDSKKATWEGTSKSVVLKMGDTSGAQRVLEKVVVTLAE